MNEKVIPISVQGSTRERKRQAPRGRRVDPQALVEVQALLGHESRQRDLLIEHLHKLQDHFGYLSAPHLAALAHEMRLSQTEVYEVATFYHHFDIVREGDTPPAELTVRVCDGLSCEMAGAQDLLDKLPGILGKDVRVIHAPCVGRCEQAPVAVVHQHPVANATLENVAEKVNGRETRHVPEPYVDFDAYKEQGGYKVIQECVGGLRDVESILDTLGDSNLRGLGGAGFPVARKWRIMRDQPAPRLAAINIDEGEPGTFKDRYYLERDPHRFLEGLLIACWVVGIDEAYIYLRDEYHGCRALLEAEVEKLIANPPVPNMPKIYTRRGAGAYICGEESAMIESIEGKRGMPRLRPPFVAQVGLWGLPTLENNFESIYWVRDIIENGADWFGGHGRHGRKGLRSFSVSGRVKEPGMKLAPAGTTLRELVDEYCGGMLDGHKLYGYLPGGASGGILPESLADVPLDFDTLQEYGCFIGSAAVIVLSDQDTAVNAARNMMRFFQDESCGQCTPCRVGTAKALQLIEDTNQWDREALEDLSTVMRDASICGLGQAAPNPFDCVIKYFPHELA